MHTLKLKLLPNYVQKDFLDKSFFFAYKMYVELCKYSQKQLRLLSKNNRYIYLKHLYKIYKNLDDKSKLKQISTELNTIVKFYNISSSDLEKYIKILQNKYKNYISSHQAQKIAKFVSNSIDDYLYGSGNKIHIKKFIEFNTISQKNTTNGIKFKGDYIDFLGNFIPVKYSNNENDLSYILNSLNNWEDNLKYCELIRIEFNSGFDYYINLVLDGDSPSKITKGIDISGIDPGVSSMAIVSNNFCILEELAPKCKFYNAKIQKLQRQIDISIRATNPNKFNPDGTFKKGNKDKFVYAKHCKYLKRKLRVLYRQKSAYIKSTHNNLINRLLNGMKKVNIERMNYQALAKRSKKTELNEYGKYKKKKRFGKSINDRSPGYFIKLLEDKCIRYHIEFNKINTQNVKASQYNHLTNSYEKYKLNDRIKLIGANIVQRDLYSAYIIKNVKKDLETIDKRKMRRDFNKFLEIQEKEIERIKSQGIKNKNFGI